MRRVRKESEENNEVHHLPGRQHGKRVGAPRSDLKNGTRLLAMVLATAIVAIRMAFPVNAVVTLSEAAFDPWSYTIVTFGDWQDDPSSSEGEHSTGPMAIGGNWTANTYSFSDARRPGASGMPQLLVEGEASGTVSGIGGDVYVKSFESISGSWDYENGYELVVTESLPVSPTSLRASITQLSNDIAAYASVPGNAINVSSTPWSTYLDVDDPNLNVFNIELKADMGAVYLNAPTTSQVVINVTNSGVVSAFPQLYLYNSSTNDYAQVSGEPMEIDKRLIWNLSAASEVQSSYNTLHGAILAPTALLKLEGGNSNGTIFVDSYYGSSEFHWSSFEGDLTFVNSTTEPTPTPTPIPTATSTPTPTPVDHIPQATDDSFTVQQDNVLTTENVLSNDNLGDEPTIVSSFDTTSAQGGTVTHSGNGIFVYTPETGFSGTDSFTYTIEDADGDTSTATVTITVTPNLLPLAVSDTFEAQSEITLTTGTVLANDTMGDADTIIIAYDQDSVENGTVWHVGGGVFEYTSDAGFTGTDTFTYTIEDADGDTSTATVTITVTAIDSQVDAVDDQFATQVDVPVSGSLIDNDIILTSSALISLDLDGLDGDVVLNTDGTFTFTPNPGFSGITTFRYTVTDANNNQDTATVTITVLGQSPTPIPTPGGVLGATPVPVNYPSINITVVPNKSVVGFGETVEYVMYVTNNGDADLTNVAVTDEVLDIYDYPIGDLSVGSTAVLTVSEVPQLAYVVLPSEAIPVLTVSVAKGTTINGAEEVTSRDDTRVDVINIVITVTSDETTVAPGAPITLIYVVTNEGSIDVTEVDLTDTNIGVVGYPIGGLKVGESVSVTSTVARGSEFISSTSPGVSVTSSPIATGSVSIDGGVTISSQASASIIISTVPSGTELVKTGEALNVYVRILGGLLMVVGAFMTKGATSKKRTTKYKRV